MSGNLPFMLDNNQTPLATCKWEKSKNCATCDIGLYAGPDAQFQLNTLSDGDAIDAMPLMLL